MSTFGALFALFPLPGACLSDDNVAIEALRDCLKQRKATFDELWQAAKVCRMTNVMRPYLEATA